MSSIKLVLSAVIIAVFSMSSITLKAGEPIAFEKQLPSTTYGYFRISDVNLMKKKFQQTVLWKLFEDPEMKPFLSQFEGKANEKWTEMSAGVEEQLGVTLNQLLDIPQGEVSVAIFTPPRKDLAIGVKVAYGENEKILQGVLGKLNDSMKEDGSEIGSVESNGVTLTTIKFVDNEEPNLIYGMKDKQLIMTSSMPAMESILERWEGKGERVFSSAAVRMGVVDSLKTSGETALLEWYLNPIDLARVSAKYAGEAAMGINMAMGFLPIIGLDQLKSVGGYADFDCNKMDGVFRTQFVLESPSSKLMNVFLFPEDTHTPPNFVQDKTLGYSAFHWDVVSAFKAIEGIVDSFQGPGYFESLIDDFAKNPFSNGIHVKKDVFDNINGKFLMTSSNSEVDGQNQVEYFVTFGFKDAEIAKGLLEKISGLDGIEVESSEIDGQFALELQDELSPDVPNPVKFIAVGKKEFIFATSKTKVQEFFKGATSGSPLADSSKYQSMRKLMPEKVSLLQMELSPAKSMEENYKNIKENGIEDMLEAIPVDEIKEFLEGVDFSKLPDVSVIKKYYSPNANYSKTNEKGCSHNYIFLKN